jgi:hypothetical protein
MLALNKLLKLTAALTAVIRWFYLHNVISSQTAVHAWVYLYARRIDQALSTPSLP